MTILEPGKIVLFFQQDTLLAALVLAQEQNHWSVVDINGNSHSLNPERFVLVSHDIATLPELQSFYSEVLEALTRIEQEQIVAAMRQAGTPLTFSQVLGLFPDNSDKAKFALFTFLNQRKDLFICRKSVYQLRTAEERENYQAVQAEKAERLKYLESVSAFLENQPDAILPEPQRSMFIEELRSILGNSAPRDLVTLLSRAQPDTPLLDVVFQQRLRLGDITEVTDTIAAASGLPISFAMNMEEQLIPAANHGEANISAFTVDAEGTQDHDDAISLTSTPDGYRLGVHISSVAERISLGSHLYREALQRVASLYLPGSTVPMLPESLSSGELSLLRGTIRPVVSLNVELDKELAVQNWSFSLQNVHVSQNYFYSGVDSQIREEPFAALHRICRKLNFERTGGQKDNKQPYHWMVNVIDGEVQMQRVNDLSPSRFMIEELMILFNRLMAEMASHNSLALIYRNITQFGDPDDENGAGFGAQAYLSTSAQFHPGIGANAYAHASSPIRRAADLINQHQFNTLLGSGLTPLTALELDAIIPTIEKRLILLHSVSLRSERYWLLRLLQSKYLYEPLDAVLLKKMRNGYLLELSSWDKRIVLQSSERLPLSEPVKLVVSSVDLQNLLVSGDVIL